MTSRSDRGYGESGGVDAMFGFATMSARRGAEVAMADRENGNTGAGAEASEGIHSTKGKRPEETSAVEHAHGEPGRGEGAGLGIGATAAS